MLVKHNNRLINLPDFFVVGAPKAGTTSLYDLMKKVNSVFLPAKKEPQYFAYKTLGNRFRKEGSHGDLEKFSVITEFEDYAKLFAEAQPGQLIGDFSTHHLRFSGEFCSNTKDVYQDRLKELKIVVLLREPSQRAYSHYLMKIRDGSETLSFIDALRQAQQRMAKGFFPSYDYVRFSQYSDDLEKLRNTFPQLYVSTFEAITASPEHIRKIFDFLNLPSENKDFSLAKLNTSGVPGKSWFSRLLFEGIFRRNRIKKYLVPKSLKKKLGSKIKANVGKHLLKRQAITEEEKKVIAEFLREEYFKLEGYYTYPL